MTRLDQLTEAAVAIVAIEFEDHGEVTVPEVLLPPGCRPPVADLVLVEIEGQVEVFVSSAVAYAGLDPYWRTIFEGEAVAGQARMLGVGPTVHQVIASLARQFARALRVGDELAAITDLSAVEVRQGPGPLSSSALVSRLSARIRGQDQALECLADRVTVQLSKRTPRRPTSLLLVGPTGVGKTQAIERLAQVLGELAGEEVGLLRLDMNEFAEGGRVSQLLGAAPGYVGYEDGAALIEVLSRNPRCIVLFDEIEKAHPSVLQVLMNLMDAGRLSHPRGRSQAIDARKAILCFTSNAEDQNITRALLTGQAFDDPSRIDAIIRDELTRGGMARELIGRFSSCIYFQPLTNKAIAEIATLSIVRVAEEFGHTLKAIDPGVVQRVLDQVASANFGARLIEYEVERQLADVFVEAADLSGPLRLRANPTRLEPWGGA